jgi:single-stranded-DNA-specific exonuclease
LAPEVEISAVLPLENITPAFWHILKQFAPFGPGNHNPVFCSKNVTDAGYSKVLKGNHLRLAVRQAGSPTHYGVAFDRGEDFAKIATKNPFHICYKLEENHWQGVRSLQLMVQDLWFR